MSECYKIIDSSFISNRNLIDNSWFTINQRGGTSGTIVNNAYTLDRWYMTYSSSAGSWALSGGNVTLTPIGSGDTAQMRQKFEDIDSLDGKALTASIMLSDGTIYSGTITRENGTTQDFFTTNNCRVRFYSDNSIAYIAVNEAKTFKAVKLEMGNVSTLHLDTAPDYATELMRCQRYFARWASPSGMAIHYGVVATSTLLDIILPHLKMRAVPTVSYNQLRVGSIGISSIQALSSYPINNGVFVRVTTSSNMSRTVGTNEALAGNANGAYLDLSADL